MSGAISNVTTGPGLNATKPSPRPLPGWPKATKILWRMVPGQDLGRAADVTMTRRPPSPPIQKGCLVCGDAVHKFGAYPWLVDIENKPWKIACPNCHSVFPTNDFGAYFVSGIDDKGLFNPGRADRSLLYNAAHPDPNDPLHSWGVDDGFGYKDAKTGAEFRFIAFYGWRYWNHIESGLSRLADAYIYTGDKKYAAKAAILLDRLADVYPSMDWKPYADRGWYHSDGNTNVGKIQGRIWECGTFNGLATNYDKILTGLDDQPGLYAFLGRMAESYRLPSPKGTREKLIANLDQNLLRVRHGGHSGRPDPGQRGNASRSDGGSRDRPQPRTGDEPGPGLAFRA